MQVAEAILTGHVTLRHVRAMARHDYPTDSTNGLLFGGQRGRDWARRSLVAAADEEIAQQAAAKPAGPDLAELARKLNEADQIFRDKVAAVLSQSIRTATRRAYRKAGARLSDARRCNATKRAELQPDWRRGRITRTFLAATSTTPDELLDESFDDASDQCQQLYRERQARRRAALLAAFGFLGLTASELDSAWGAAEDQRASALGAFIVSAMFSEAQARFEAGSSAPTSTQGERGFDKDVPTRIVADVVQIADGAPVDPAGVVSAEEPVDSNAAPVIYDYTDDLARQVIDQMAPEAVTTYVWAVGAPERPFEPHQELAGLEATNETYFVVFAKDPGDFPVGNTYWLPSDHDGCQCWLEISLSAGSTEDEGQALDGVDPDAVAVG